MIGLIKGEVVEKTERALLLDTASPQQGGGLGYEVNVLPGTRNTAKLGETLSLFAYLAVREDALELYGFADKRELEFFKLLISISGIGPKGAIAVLAIAPPDTLEKAVRSGDTNYLTRVSGIGKKRAEKIVLELKDKLGSLETGAADHNLQGEADALEALQSLGYSLPEAREALKKVSPDITDTSEKVKAALKVLGK